MVKFGFLSICLTAVLLMPQESLNAEIMAFQRTDSNDASASTVMNYYDNDDFVLQNYGYVATNNSSALSALGGTPSSTNGSASFTAGTTSFNVSVTNGVTTVPNVAIASEYDVTCSIGNVDISGGASGSVVTTYQLEPPINSGVDTVVATAVLRVSSDGISANVFPTYNLREIASALGVELKFDFDAFSNYVPFGSPVGTASITDGSNILWSEDISPRASYVVTVERVIPLNSQVSLSSSTFATTFFTGAPWAGFNITGESTSSCSVSAVGLDSTIDSVPAEQLRVFVQVLDPEKEEEEQDPPIAIYPVEPE